MIDMLSIYWYYIDKGGDLIKAKLGFKVDNKWNYLTARGDLEALIEEVDDLIRRDAVTQVTVKFYYRAEEN